MMERTLPGVLDTYTDIHSHTQFKVRETHSELE